MTLQHTASSASPSDEDERYYDVDQETAAVHAHLEGWAEAEHQRRTSVRHTRRAKAMEQVTHPIRRRPTRPRVQTQALVDGQQPAVAKDATRAGEPSTSLPPADCTSLPAPPPVAAVMAPGMSIARTVSSSLPSSPLGPRGVFFPPAPASSSQRNMLAGGHREVGMTHKFRLRPPHDSGIASGRLVSSKPNPTGARPIVTAGPTPVRIMRAKETTNLPKGSSDPVPLKETPEAEEMKKELAQGDVRQKRGFWLTDLLCCSFGSSNDEEQAAKTNPNE